MILISACTRYQGFALSHPIMRDEAWNSPVYGDSFSIVTYDRNILRISYDFLIPLISIL